MNQFRAIKPGTELHFNDGFNVLLGINGTGKTTLLDLITMIGNGNFPGLENEEFDLEGDLHSDRGILSVKAWNQRSTDGKECNFELHLNYSPVDQKKARFTIETNGYHALLRVGESETSQTELFRIAGLPFSDNFLKPSFIRSVMDAFFLAESRTEVDKQLRREVEASRQDAYFCASLWSRYDEALTFPKKLHEEMSLRGFWDQSKFFPLWNVGVPSEVVTYFQNRVLSQKPSDQISIESADCPPLGKAVAALGFQSATLVLALQDQRPRRRDQGLEVSYTTPRFYLSKRDGTRLLLEKMSFGQQRLFGFFYYLSMHPDTVIADELANGMHHGMIADCVRAIGERQAFLATQNPLLLDHMTFDSPEQVRSTFVLCETVIVDGRECMQWSQLTAEDAAGFFHDYQVGFQHNNDILRSRGLW